MIRQASSFLQAVKQITVKKFLDPLCDEFCKEELEFAIEKLEQAVGITQHHDAITGTEQQHVANDYHQRLDRAQYLASIVTFSENGGGSQYYCKYSNIRYL